MNVHLLANNLPLVLSFTPVIDQNASDVIDPTCSLSTTMSPLSAAILSSQTRLLLQ